MRTVRSLVLTLCCIGPIAPLVASTPDVVQANAFRGASSHATTLKAGYYLYDGWVGYQAPAATASVDVETEIRLEDGTLIERQDMSWTGPMSTAVNPAGSLGAGIDMSLGGMIGAWTGWSAGTSVATWATGAAAAGSTTAEFAVGIGAVTAGPFLGALALAGAGIA